MKVSTHQKVKPMRHSFSLLVSAVPLLLSSCGDPKPPAASTSDTPTPAAAKSATPTLDTLTIESPTFVPPAQTAGNRLLAHKFRQCISSAHSACGLKPVEFQESIDRLQHLSAGTDFQDLAVSFVMAARLCHDVQIKPTKYVSNRSESSTLTEGLKVSPRLDVTATGAITLQVPVDRSTSKGQQSDLMQAVEFASEISVSPETLKKLHEMEDSAYIAVLESIKHFPQVKRSDISGKKFSWKWNEEGRIIFSLHSNGTMEAALYPASNELIYKLSDWGDGDWDLNADRLVITMRRVGKRGVPFLTKEHKVTWVNHRIEGLSEDGLLLENDRSLHFVDSE